MNALPIIKWKNQGTKECDNAPFSYEIRGLGIYLSLVCKYIYQETVQKSYNNHYFCVCVG